MAVMEERETAQRREQALRDASNLRNKERTDETHAADRARAATVSVRASKPSAIVARPVAPASGSDTATSCIDRGELRGALAAASGRLAERLGGAVAEIERRHAERLTAVARAGEALAADLRACVAFARGVQSNAPGADPAYRVGGVGDGEAPGVVVVGPET
jgi:hypothetical protein